MKEKIFINTDKCYRLAEQQAAVYFQTLYQRVTQKVYAPVLTKDFQAWKQNHIHHYFSVFSRKKNTTDYKQYISWLEAAGKLDPYLDRSISYLFLRDLGKSLATKETQSSVRRTVDRLKKYLTSSQADFSETFSLAGLYRWAQTEGVETQMIWLIDKLKAVSSHLPDGMDKENAKRKLIKIIAGVLMHVYEELDPELPTEERSLRIGTAIRLGYSYGLTYPFIDDLLDANILSGQEKQQYSRLIRTTLTEGAVPNLGKWSGENSELIHYIHTELREAFEYMKSQQRGETLKSFFEQAYVFFQAQEVDRKKELSYPHYTNEELYLPVMLKSAYSRLMVRSVIGAPEDQGFHMRTFYYGIYNQLADDLADLFADLEAGSVTPYTYYLTYHHRRSDLLNPYELYWTVIAYLIHDVYQSDPKTSEVIFDRAINGLKRLKARLGKEKYNEMMVIFASGQPQFNRTIQQLVRKADDVDFFDKLMRDEMVSILKKESKEQEDFLQTIEAVRQEINEMLPIPKLEQEPQLEDPIIAAANYSLVGDGKRLRPIMTWMMGVNEYGLKKEAIKPLLRSLEYMHTASLIFDDLPAQDNSAMRRGRPTLHHVYNAAIAELTGLFLTQKAIEEQASLHQFDGKTVLQLIQYSAQMTELMCRGQALDLEAKGKALTLEQLNQMCLYKTGMAFEAALVMPAILAHAEEAEIIALKKFAHHAGIAFQIKDDLLDVEGDQWLLGKPLGKDVENSSSTFVTILGQEGAKKEMWEHYCLAIEAVQQVPRNTAFLKHVLDYFVNRDH